ncbi:Xpo1-domain-containing protein [Metschnikowia bicuspidata var. bicuspidata NRRL YB-4993]|uniref:Exportin-T n=1 Tax=Metschnikowia bicuspidata var. bicuspidata NRRL YB-4993 TaxID=869754 RepID=A0A1A0HBG9_9ASCO|nr:Xpo1-domain-containing protein [Metschnikowia bicuspidata var. bicuspidata NRRL YB-4993]OBA21222.1 Xpo1-domain-containing protein [Metschnikowia bicuspidata var. bicuspidata NRRL YB-4993]
MDQQIQQAVEIALSGTSDPQLKNQALQFINEIKSTEEGFKSCVDILLESSAKGGTLNNGLKFFIFQVIDENTDKLSQEQLYALNTNLFKYLNDVIAANLNDEVYLKNKLSDLFGRMFCYVYPLINVDFLKTFLILIQSQNLMSIDYYMRTLISIHFEIGDKLISRAKDSQERNNFLKDLIRDRDMSALVSSWKSALTEIKDTVILDNTLKVVGYYIDWMDFSLFMQDGFLSIIYEFLKNHELRNQACLTLLEMISKKMKPINKLQLINMLELTSVIGSLKDDDLDFIENLSRLSNQIGMELCIALENDPSLVSEISLQLAKLWPITLEFLIHEYDDVSQQVFPFIQQYLLIAKKFPAVTSNELLSALLKNIIEKMRYEADNDGFDDDDQFMDIRQKLKTFQDTIAGLNPSLYLDVVPLMIESSIFGGQSASESQSWNVVELGLYELSNFADSLKNNLINLPKSEISTSKPYRAVQDLLIKIINNVHILSHPKNQLAFFELIIRHFSTKNFLNTTQTSMDELSSKILELFSEYGLFNGVESVRLRCWYLFFRFVSATKPGLNSFFLENLLIKLQPLLVIKAELPTRDEDNDLVEHGNFNSQLYLFEALGMLVTLTNSPQTCATSVDVLLQPLFGNLEACISRDDKDINPLIPLQTHHLLFAIATIVKGLDTLAPGKSDSLKSNAELAIKIGNAAQVVLISLENFNKFESVRDAARFAFARLVPIMETRSSAYLSKLISLILASPNLKIQELGDFAGFVGQLVHQFRNNESVFQLLNDLMTPMIQKIYETLTIEDENYPNLVREKYDLKKSFLSFISILVINNQFSLLLTETNKAILPKILSSMVEFSCDLFDSMTAKSAITQFGNVITVLGCNGGKLNDNSDMFASTLAPIEGIDEYLMDSTVKLCFELPFREKDFNLKDAQIRNIAMELSILLTTYQKRLSQQEFVHFLANYLTKMGLDEEIAKDFCTNLVQLSGKDFKKYYVTFLGELKK